MKIGYVKVKVKSSGETYYLGSTFESKLGPDVIDIAVENRPEKQGDLKRALTAMAKGDAWVSVHRSKDVGAKVERAVRTMKAAKAAIDEDEF